VRVFLSVPREHSDYFPDKLTTVNVMRVRIFKYNLKKEVIYNYIYIHM
jgi:hypothetical protein